MNKWHRPLNLKQYRKSNHPLDLGPMLLQPEGDTNILRMLLWHFPMHGVKLPEELSWAWPLVYRAREYQQGVVKVRHPFMYLTVRTGREFMETTDQWHVDGFSMRITHLPEQNYVWSSEVGTRWAPGGWNIPRGFDPLRHNIHSFFQHKLSRGTEFIGQPMDANRLWLIDPYVVHKAPDMSDVSEDRVFVRLTFSPIEIADVNNTPNPSVPRTNTYDGVREFRDTLEDWG